MVVKRWMSILLSGTALGAALIVAAPARADDAQTEQLQRQINALQKQLQGLQGQVTETKKAAQAAQQAAQNPPPPAALPAGLYNAAPPGAASPMPTKGPAWMSGVTIKVGGFIEAATVWRERNELSSGASDPSFGSLPFQNTPLYSENENRFSAQQSRLSLAAYGDIDPYEHLKAYYEMDFLGAGVTANSRESNSYNLRIRQAFFEYDNDNYHFHMSAGQQWSLLTQERVGMLPTNENAPLVIDAQYVVGFNWARQPGIRFVEDWNKVAWFGLSFESPQAAIGGTLPGASAAYPFIVNAANNCNNSGLLDSATYCSNDVAPDIIEKVALDPGWGHYEVFGVERWFADQVSPGVGAAATPANWSTKTTFGWDVGGSALVPVVPKYLDVQGSVMYGMGGGRYGSSQLSDVTYGANGALQPLPILTGLVGAVVHPWTGLDVYAYAGQEQVTAKFFGVGSSGYGNPLAINNGCLTENPAYANNPGGIGAGSFNSAIAGTTCTANVQRTQEITVGLWEDLYKGNMGRVALGLQYEYVRLTAFSGVPGAAAGNSTPNQGLNPNNNIFFTSLRYYPFP
jgi:hypothetical protein